MAEPANDVDELNEKQVRARYDAAVASEQPDLIGAEEKALAAAGVKVSRKDEKAAAEARAATAEEQGAQAGSEPPKGRTATAPKRTTAEGKA
jgi:hypothetical protein